MIIGCVYVVHSWHTKQDLLWKFRAWSGYLLLDSLDSLVVSHDQFGGASNAKYLIYFKGPLHDSFIPQACMHRTLQHLVTPTCCVSFPVIAPTHSLGQLVAWTPIEQDGVCQINGLWDVYHPLLQYACPSVFAPTKGVKCKVVPSEIFRLWDQPLTMDGRIGTKPDVLSILPSTLSTLVISTIFQNLWDSNMGGY
jgi:hypothetical protein